MTRRPALAVAEVVCMAVVVVAALLSFPLAPPVSAHAETGGEFTSSCAISHTAADDPIVRHGQPGAAHLHDFFGNDSTDANSTYRTLRVGTTSCDTRPADTAAYWLPALLYDGIPFAPEVTRVYYRGTGITDAAAILPFPPNLRMIAGDPMAGQPQDIAIVSWACTIPGGGSGGNEVEVDEVPVTCNDQPLRMRVVFPQCWDGVHRDSDDHQSHMAYARGEACPADHPVALPQLTYSTRYWLTGDLRGHVTLAAMNSPNTGHADFINSWPQRVLAQLVRECINVGVDCDPNGVPR